MQTTRSRTRSSPQTTNRSANGRFNTTTSRNRVPRVSHSFGRSTTAASGSRPQPRVQAMERHDFGVSGDEGEQTSDPISSQRSRPNGRLCDTFTGMDPLVKIEDWLGLFEMVTRGYSDEEKLTALCRHVSSEAMVWLVREIGPIQDSIPWNEVKIRIKNRFGRAIHNHLMEAFDRELKTNETIESYFNDKRRLMTLAGESETNQVALLTRGLTSISMRKHITAQRPKTPFDWLEIALALETINDSTQPSNRGKRSDSQIHHNESDNKHGFKGNRNKPGFKPFPPIDFTKPPTLPCPLCKQLGLKEIHWKRDCPHFKQFKSTQQKTHHKTDSTSNTGATHASNTVEPLNFVHFKVFVNGKPLRPFLDSGSTLTAMSKAAAERLKFKWKPEEAILLKHVDGVTKTLGALDAKIKIEGKTFRFPIQILEKFAHDMLLGLDIAHAAGLVVDFGKQVSSRSFALQPLDASLFSVITDDSSQTSNKLKHLIERTDIFAQNSRDFGRIRNTQHVIRLKPEAVPFNLPPYRCSAQREAELKKHIEDLLESGLIRKSHSPFASPMFLVQKADKKSWRPVINYKQLNEMTISERHPLPIIRDLFDKLSGSSIFSCLDIAWGYWHVSLHPDSVEKSAFVTPFGQFEWLTLPMGLKNSSSCFQREVRRILDDFLGKGVEQFLDDIIVHTSTEDEHLILLTKVFDRLTEEGVKLRKEKCHLFVREVTFLGHVISAGQVRPSPEKTRALREFPTPVNLRKVREFVGLANFYRSFVPNFSAIVTPLTALTKKNAPFIWTEDHQKAFDKLKQVLTEPPFLAIFDPSLQLTLSTDASIEGLGAVLSQKDADNKSHVIAFWSQKLNQHERRYTVPELECLAVVRAVEHFKVYLDGVHFEVLSDCSCLRWLFNLSNPNSRLFRWSVLLSAYDFTVRYRPGSSNNVADALSRSQICAHMETDEFLERQSELNVYNLKKPLVRDGLVTVHYRGSDRTVVPPSLVDRVLRQFHEERNHPGVQKTKQAIASQFWWPSRDESISKHVKSCHTCQTNKPPNVSLARPFNPLQTPERPNSIWSIDAIVMGCAANETAAKIILTVIDLHSRHVWATAVKRQTTEVVINFLSNLFDAVGEPDAMLSDNGLNFTSKRFEKFLENRQIKHLLTPPYRSQANGVCEKANGKIIAGLRLALTDNPKFKWSTLLRKVVRSLNEQTHDVTRFTPRFLQFGLCSDSPTVPVEKARQLAMQRSRDDQETRRRVSSEKSKHSDFQIGDLVRYRLPDNHPERASKLSPQWWAPCKIIEKFGQETFRMDQLDPNDNSVIRTFNSHSGRLASYFSRNTESDGCSENLNQNSSFSTDEHSGADEHPISRLDSNSESIATQESDCLSVPRIGSNSFSDFDSNGKMVSNFKAIKERDDDTQDIIHSVLTFQRWQTDPTTRSSKQAMKNADSLRLSLPLKPLSGQTRLGLTQIDAISWRSPLKFVAKHRRQEFENSLAEPKRSAADDRPRSIASQRSPRSVNVLQNIHFEDQRHGSEPSADWLSSPHALFTHF